MPVTLPSRRRHPPAAAITPDAASPSDSPRRPSFTSFNSTPFPFSFADDTVSSLSSATEAQDLGRISRLLSARASASQPALPGTTAPFSAHHAGPPLLGKYDARRDQQRLEAARHGRLAESSSYPEPPPMIRRRTATGEEVVNGGNEPSSRRASSMLDPLLKKGSEQALRDFPAGLLKVTPNRDMTPEEREAARIREAQIRASIDKAAAKKAAEAAAQSQPRRVRQLFFGRHVPKLQKDQVDAEYSPDQTGGVVDWLEAGNSTPELESKKSGARPILSKSATTRPRGIEGDESSPNPDARRSAGPRSVSLSSKASHESLRSLQDRPTAPLSRIPKPSPTNSRPASSYDKVSPTPSTTSARETRRPLGRTPSISSIQSGQSLKSATSATASVHRESLRSSNSLRDRRASHASAVSTSPEKPKPTRPTERKGSHPTAASLKRSESAPVPASEKDAREHAISSPTPSANPSIASEDSSLVHVKLDKGKQATDGDMRQPKPSVRTIFDDESPVSMRERGNSMESVFSRRSLPSNSDANSPAVVSTASSTPWLKTVQREGLRSPTLSDYDELTASAGNTDNKPVNGLGIANSVEPSPLYNRSTGAPNPHAAPPPKSRLEDDSDTDDGALEILVRDSRDFESLLNPPKPADPDDDTFMLLGGATQYDPEANRPVRPRAETIEADRRHFRDQALAEKYARKLETLEIEMRLARRGIELVERRLNGFSSDDEADWVDEDEAAAAAAATLESKRGKLRKHLGIDKNDSRPPSRGERMFQWGVLVFQLVGLWFLLEIAL